MSSRGSISYTPGTKPGTEYYLATTASLMQFYCFDEPMEGAENKWTLIEHLDRNRLLAAGDKKTAKEWAKRLKLKSWTYVRV